jgi:mercuric ion binding protein
MKIIISSLIIILSVNFVNAQSNAHTIAIKINGLVCNFCATNLDKTFEDLPEVSNAYVNLKVKTVLIELKPGASLTDEVLKLTVEKAGFGLKSSERLNQSFDDARAELKSQSSKIPGSPLHPNG